MEEENWIVIGDVYEEGVDYFDVEAKIDKDDDEDLQLSLRFKLQIEGQFITVERSIWITEPTSLKLMCATLEERTKKLMKKKGLNKEEEKDANRNR